MVPLKPGSSAPDFALVDQNGKTVRLGDFKGRKLLLYFYPKADTPGCTTQACSVRDSAADLTKAGVAAVGVSPDPPADQKKFDTKYSLAFPLLSDTDHKVAKAYDVWGEKTLDGKKVQGIIRSAFLIDERGKILKTFYNVSPADTVPLALAALKK